MLLLWIPIACILGTISALPQLTVCGSQIVNTFCQMICTTDDFSQIVLFQKDTVSQGGCSSGGTCNTGITGYSIYRSGTQQTILNITAYDRTRDPGDWTCALGASVSTVTTTDYAIPPTSATVTSANNITVNVTTDVTVTTECAYINISGILKLQNTGYSQRQTCDEVPSGGCAAGLGEKYTCTFTFQPTTVAAGTYLLQFHVDLPNDNTDPGVQLTTDTYITFEPSSTTTLTSYSSSYSGSTGHFLTTTSPGDGNLSTNVIIGVICAFSVVAVFIGVVCAIRYKRKPENTHVDNGKSTLSQNSDFHQNDKYDDKK